MKKILAALITVALICSTVVAFAETSVDTIGSWIEDCIGEGETIVAVILNNQNLEIDVDLGDFEDLYDGYAIDLADTRSSSITDELLDHEEFDDEWNTITLAYAGIGFATYTKADIAVNEYNMRYINVYNEDGSSRMVPLG